MTIPDELKEIKQWTYSYNEEELKRPTHTKYVLNGGVSYDTAVRRAGKTKYIGFYTTSEDPYILLDIDGLFDPENPYAELPVDLAAFLQAHRTYTEISPSGRGLRLVYRLVDGEDKSRIQGSYFKYKGDLGEGAKGKEREAQINFGPPWQTITENSITISTDTVCKVSLDNLITVFPIIFKEAEDKPTPKQEFGQTRLPTMVDIAAALDAIPLDQNPRVQRAYKKVFNQKYQHYEFWVKIMMAVHHYSSLTGKDAECLGLVLKWSQRDKDGYESEEDVLKHWRSFNTLQEKDIVSYKSLFGLAYQNRLFWPVPRKRTKDEERANSSLKPLNTEYSNFCSLVDHYDVKVYRDENDINHIYITGDEDVIRKYFIMHGVKQSFGRYWGPFSHDTLIPAFHIMMQDNGFIGASHMLVKGFIKNLLAQTRRTINLIKMYFDTPYEKLPPDYRTDEKYYESTTFDKLFDCLVIDHTSVQREQEEELYRAYYKKWLMGIIRNLYYPHERQMNNCVMLLTGAEQIRKTSHFKFLLPPFMRDFVAFTTHGFAQETAMRDVVKLASTNLILVWDELEQYLVSGTESNFKKIIDGNPQKIIDKYETTEKLIIPIAIYGATSNRREFNLGSEGSRRIFHIPVKWVHTEKMEEINWHKLINDLRREVSWTLKSGESPWLLTAEQLEYQFDLHHTLRAKTNADLILNEIWDFDEPIVIDGHIPGVNSIQSDKTGRLLTTTEIKNTIAKAGHNVHNIKLPALTKSLERMCGSYTKTLRKKITVEKPKCVVDRGQAIQHQYKKWVMPPMRKEAAHDMFRQFKDIT